MKMGGKVSRNVPNNEELSSPSFIMSLWLVKKTCIQGDPGGKQCYYWRDSDKRPKPIPSCLHKDKRYGCEPTPMSNPSRLRRRKRNVTTRATIDMGNTTEKIVNVNEDNPVPVEETEPAENTEK